MAKVSRILALLAIVAMLAALPMTALAQQEPPHVVMGMAMVNGATPAAGTEITAHAGAMEVGSAMTKAGGGFRVDVKNPSGTDGYVHGWRGQGQPVPGRLDVRHGTARF